MRKRIIRSLTATVLITSIMGMTVLADEVTDIKNQQNSLAQEKQNVEDELAFLRWTSLNYQWLRRMMR